MATDSIALLANTIATGAALVALILTVSGVHFNPAVTLADASHVRTTTLFTIFAFRDLCRVA